MREPRITHRLPALGDRDLPDLKRPTGTDLGLTVAAGTVRQAKAYVMDEDEARALTARARQSDTTGYLSHPTGDAVPRRPPPENPHGWPSRQNAVAARLLALWKASLKGSCGPAGYAGGNRGGNTLSREEEEASHRAFCAYLAAMDEIEHRCSPRHRGAVRVVVVEEGAMPGSGGLVREGLDCLVAWWRVK